MPGAIWVACAQTWHMELKSLRPSPQSQIDLVIEGTGVFIDTPGAGKHIQVGGSLS